MHLPTALASCGKIPMKKKIQNVSKVMYYIAGEKRRLYDRIPRLVYPTTNTDIMIMTSR